MSRVRPIPADFVLELSPPFAFVLGKFLLVHDFLLGQLEGRFLELVGLAQDSIDRATSAETFHRSLNVPIRTARP